MAVVTVRPFNADEWQAYRALRLESLRESPDAFGALLAEQQDWPDIMWKMRLAAGVQSADDLPLLAQRGGQPAGLAWGKADAADIGVAHFYQVWVAPQHRGHGIAALLLNKMITWATAKQITSVRLSVALNATAATRLYRDAGFLPFGEPEPLRSGSQLLSQPMRRFLALLPCNHL